MTFGLISGASAVCENLNEAAVRCNGVLLLLGPFVASEVSAHHCRDSSASERTGRAERSESLILLALAPAEC